MKVLIFDDDEDILSICTYILEEEGWQIKSQTDCREVIAIATSFAPDVILMDNWIPDEGGIAATQLLKKHPLLKKIPVIYFSANSDIQSLAEKAGAEYYMPKPFDLEDLKTVILAAID